MKNFLLLLAKSIVIALIISLSVYFFARHWGNWRAILWYVFGLLAIWQAWKFLQSDIMLCEYENHEKIERNVTLLEKTEELITGLFFILLGGCGFWCMGRITEKIFNYPSAIFEYTIAKGFVTFSLLCIACWMMKIAYSAIKELK